MKVESMIDVDRADQIVREIEGLVTMAEPALEADELETLNDAMDFIEDAAGIQTGEKLMDSPTTGTTYRVTRWVDAGEGQVVALAKTEADDR